MDTMITEEDYYTLYFMEEHGKKLHFVILGGTLEENISMGEIYGKCFIGL